MELSKGDMKHIQLLLSLLLQLKAELYTHTHTYLNTYTHWLRTHITCTHTARYIFGAQVQTEIHKHAQNTITNAASIPATICTIFAASIDATTTSAIIITASIIAY